MIRYYKICKKYFSLKLDHKKYLCGIFITSILRCLLFALTPIFAAKIVDYGTAANYKLMFLNILFLAINYYVYVFVHHLNFIVFPKNVDYVYNSLQKKVVSKVSMYDEDFTKHVSKSYLNNSVGTDIFEISLFVDHMIDAVSHFITDLFSLGILVFYDFRIGIFVLCFNILYQVLLSKTLKIKDRYLTLQRKQQDNIVELYDQIIDANKEVKSFSIDDSLKNHLNLYKRNWSKQYCKRRNYYNRANVILPMIISISKFFVYFIVINQIINERTTIGSLILVISYIERIERENTLFFSRINNVCNTSIRIDRIYKILNYHNKNIIKFGKYEEDDIFGNIVFENVNFSYENKQTLKNASFEIESNQITAIVGKSGSGKSTIFKILLRLYKIDNGNVYIDGKNIFDYTKEVYPKNVSIVTQTPFIFNMSIRDNLALVNPNIKEQEEACKRVGIHNFICSLPKGYNTILKEGGTNISGGQKQLLSIARVLLSKAEILLFDEVTSALDPSTTKKVKKILKNLKKDHTVVIISHKEEIMKMADKIIVVDNGKIVGIGKHKELLKNNMYYQNIQKN